MIDLGVLKPYALRQIWPKEADDFTVWLGKNLDRLSSAFEILWIEYSRERKIRWAVFARHFGP